MCEKKNALLLKQQSEACETNKQKENTVKKGIAVASQNYLIRSVSWIHKNKTKEKTPSRKHCVDVTCEWALKKK